MLPFIYIMHRTDRDKMVKLGFELVKEDEASSLWIFANSDDEKHVAALEKIEHVLSDIISL